MLTNYISEQGQDWHLYLNACCYKHNTFVTPSIGYSPFELVYLHKPTDLVNIRFHPFKGKTQDVNEYINMMKRRFSIIKKVFEEKKLQTQQAQLERQERVFSDQEKFAVGDLVFLYAPTLSGLQTSSKKFKHEWIGPLQIQAVLDQSHFMLADWQGKILPFFGSVHISRLRHCFINLGKMDGRKIATVHNTKDLISQWTKLYPEN